MSTRVFITFLLLTSVFLFCSKDSVSPEKNDTNGLNVKAFRMSKKTIEAVPPNFVNIMFQVTDMDGNGVGVLPTDRFILMENETQLRQLGSSINIRKKEHVPYTLKTVLLLCNNQSTDLVRLKAGTLEFINNMIEKQSIALMTFSDKMTIQDFTEDASALSSALEGIDSDGAEVDLYGAITAGLNHCEEIYSNDMVQQCILVLITDSMDNQGTQTLEDVFAERDGNEDAPDKQIYVIGLGSNVNMNELEQLGNAGVMEVTDLNTITEKCSDAATFINNYSEGFYWLNYMSQRQGFETHSIKLSISGNENSGEGSFIEGTFRSSYFYSVEEGLFINISQSEPSGIDSLSMHEEDTTRVHATTTFATSPPQYQWISDNSAVVKVEPDSINSSVCTVMAVGGKGQSANITCKDIGNNKTKLMKVNIVDYQMGSILREWWTGISGTAVSNLTSHPDYPNNPSGRNYLTAFEAPTDWEDDYGTRVRGYLVPAKSGEYTFWIASDDNGELWLSINHNPDHKQRIARVISWTDSREWTKNRYQKSSPISLEGDKAYYIEAIQKEGGGGDNLAVAWEGPDFPRMVINGTYLAPVPINQP
jgi:hypothetical protein